MFNHPNNKLAVKADWKSVVRIHQMRGDNCPWLPAWAFENHAADDYRDINLQGDSRPEIWKPILSIRGQDISGQYEVSNHGRVRTWYWQILKPKIDGGKARVSLQIASEYHYVVISRLVHEAFTGPIPQGHEVDHINRKPLDNHVSNLRSASRSQNLANKGALTKDSGYIGVHRYRDKWEAVIHCHKKEVGKKQSRDKIICAIYHDLVSKRYYGEHAAINFPDGLPDGYTYRDAYRPELEPGVKFPLFGVSMVGKRFRAHVYNKTKTYINKCFDNPIEAAVARDKAYLEMTKRKPRLNFSTSEHVGLYDSFEEAQAAVEDSLKRANKLVVD